MLFSTLYYLVSSEKNQTGMSRAVNEQFHNSALVVARAQTVSTIFFHFSKYLLFDCAVPVRNVYN